MSIKAHRRTPEPLPVLGDSSIDSDYADAVELVPMEERSAEEWARATLEDGPVALRGFVVAGWRLVLRLELGRSGSPNHVAGWPIVLNTPTTVVLGVKSGAVGRAWLTFRCDPSAVSASSNVKFERRGGRVIWAVVGILHRRILPYLLGHAASSPPRT